MTLREQLDKRRDKASACERIYEPKYGGKDHSGYETLMKYEINDEREDCFSMGFDLAVELLWPVIESAIPYAERYEKALKEQKPEEEKTAIARESFYIWFQQEMKVFNALTALKARLEGGT